MEKSIYSKDYRLVLAWLLACRKAKGLTLRQVGQRLDVNHTWVARVEHGDRRMDLGEFVLLCKAIGCDPFEGLSLLVNEPVPKAYLKAADKGPSWKTLRKTPGR